MSKLIIHIGSPKTGTTSIQDTIFNEYDNLEKLGCKLPKFDLKSGQGQKLFRRALLRDGDKELINTYTEFFKVNHELGNNMLLSNEELWTVNPKRIIEVFPIISNLETSIIVFMRNIKDFFRSHYYQYLKTGGTLDYLGFYEKRKSNYNYKNKMDEWNKHFKINHLSYEEHKNSLINTFYKEIFTITGINNNIYEFLIHIAEKYSTKTKSNKTLSSPLAFLMYILNRSDENNYNKDLVRKLILDLNKVNNIKSENIELIDFDKLDLENKEYKNTQW